MSTLAPRQNVVADADSVTDKQRFISELMRQDILKVASSFRPLLLAHGYFPETVDRWIYKTQDELLNLKVHMYIKVSDLPTVIRMRDSQFFV